MVPGRDSVVTLIGMPGGGKSTVGKVLAQRLGVAFADTDEVIEQRAGCSVASYFERVGEEGFRRLERDTLAELVETRPSVIATGGGVVLDPCNRAVLSERTLPVYLHATLEELWRRVRRNNRRPLLRVSDPHARLRALYEERHPVYRDLAVVRVETGAPRLSVVVDAVIAGLTLLDGERTPAAQS